MKRLSQINESIWSDIQDKSTGEQVRKEDNIGNIQQIKPVDMGGTVLWGDKDLEIDNQKLFTYEQTEEVIGQIKGWRLPTLKEVAELDGHNFYYDNDHIYFDDDRKLSFEKKGVGYQFGGKGSKRYLTTGKEKVFYGWTSEPYKYSSNDVHVFIIDNSSFNYSSLTYDINDQVTKDANSYCSIRLVKDK